MKRESGVNDVYISIFETLGNSDKFDLSKKERRNAAWLLWRDCVLTIGGCLGDRVKIAEGISRRAAKRLGLEESISSLADWEVPKAEEEPDE